MKLWKASFLLAEMFLATGYFPMFMKGTTLELKLKQNFNTEILQINKSSSDEMCLKIILQKSLFDRYAAHDLSHFCL